MLSNEKKYMLALSIFLTIVPIIVGAVFKINLIVFSIIILILTLHRMKLYNYKIKNNSIIYSDGLILKSVKTVPIKSINQLIVRENPISKIFNVCSVIVITNSSFLWMKYISKNIVCKLEETIFGEI